MAFDEKTDLLFMRRETLPFHANGMRLQAFDAAGREVLPTHLLLGGRWLRRQRRGGRRRQPPEGDRPRHHGAALPFHSGAELLAHGHRAKA
jgi:L-serine dehydratase